MPPTIQQETPENQEVKAGQSAIFVVRANGAKPLTYQWRRNGKDISGATSDTYKTPSTSMSDQRALFDCVVSDSSGSSTSRAAAMTVNKSDTAAAKRSAGSASSPVITIQPSNQTVAAGQAASFSVTAEPNNAPLSYQWKKNGTAIAGATSANYTTQPVTTSDHGAEFSVEVSDSAGNCATSSFAVLTVA